MIPRETLGRLILVLAFVVLVATGCQASWKDGGGQRLCIGSNPKQPCEALDEQPEP